MQGLIFGEGVGNFAFFSHENLEQFLLITIKHGKVPNFGPRQFLCIFEAIFPISFHFGESVVCIICSNFKA